MKYFYVINIENKNLSALLNGIRVLADPFIKHSAHITVRGPYSRRFNFNNINSIIADTKIEVNGVADFFKFNQNTVYLKCHSDSLKEITYKKDYPDSYNPHITLYDGNNDVFAKRFRKIVSKYNFQFFIKTTQIEPLKSQEEGGRKKIERFILRDEFYSNLSYYLKQKIDYNSILDLSENERLDLIEKLCKYFTSNNPNVYPSPIQDVIKKLDYNENNGLFYFDNYVSWSNKFPYRIEKALKEIKPYAFHFLYKNGETISSHPTPFNQPFILFFDNPVNSQDIHKKVFSFGLSPIIFIDDVNSLSIYNGLELLTDRKMLKKIGDSANISNFSLENLIYGKHYGQFFHKHFNKSKKVDDYLLENISETRNILIKRLELKPKISNSLIGRLIFIRYLIDRGVKFKDSDKQTYFFSNSDNRDYRNNLFLKTIKNKEKLYEFFEFLNRKLKGDLFPVTDFEIETVNEKHLKLLYYLFKGGKVKDTDEGYSIQDSLFDIYDFRIIPIELISNIYENFIGGKKQFKNKAFYTPSFLVDYILSLTISKHLSKQTGASCKVLDPSCGSGIFLIETLRKLIEKHHANNNKLTDGQLWKIIQNNIFGIDIDSNAIDIAIFSLYVTILDYKEPKEISGDFEFKELKNKNFFAGIDFFNEEHSFNLLLREKRLDFIIGNPPWGHVVDSTYVNYINKRAKSDSSIAIGAKEISQAFIIRAQDIMSSNTKCSFIISSKSFYNKNKPSGKWRQYILEHFDIDSLIELSPVNNKIAGGQHIFEGARQPAAIISYVLPNENAKLKGNQIQHITFKPYLSFNYFKSFVLSQYDVKTINQNILKGINGENDWAWKVFVHGNYLDYHLIKKLKSNSDTIKNLNNISMPKEGMKYKDGSKKYETRSYLDWKFVETSMIESFRIKSIRSWRDKANELSANGSIDDQFNVGYLPDQYFFKGPMVLIREALTKDFNAHCVYMTENVLFNQSLSALKIEKGENDSTELNILLKSLVGLFNSELFTYFIFHTSSSAGIDRARAIIGEFMDFPVRYDEDISEISIHLQKLYAKLGDGFYSKINIQLEKDIKEYKQKLNAKIFQLYELTEKEIQVIRYTLDVSIPLLKRNPQVFRQLKFTNENDILLIKKYIQLVEKYLGKHLKVNVIDTTDFLALFYEESLASSVVFTNASNLKEMISNIGKLSYNRICRSLFQQRSVIGYETNVSYIIKPNEFKCWHPATAYYDFTSLEIDN